MPFEFEGTCVFCKDGTRIQAYSDGTYQAFIIAKNFYFMESKLADTFEQALTFADLMQREIEEYSYAP